MRVNVRALGVDCEERRCGRQLVAFGREDAVDKKAPVVGVTLRRALKYERSAVPRTPL